MNEEYKKDKEPKISELEEMIKAFQQIHGEAELNVLIDSLKNTKIKQESKKEETIPLTSTQGNIKEDQLDTDQFIYPNNLEGVKKERSYHRMNSKKFYPKLKSFFVTLRTFFKIKAVRWVTAIAVAFLAIYLTFNLPTIITRANYEPRAETKTIRTTEIVQDPSADSAAIAPGEVIPVESRIIISKIGVNAPIIFVDSKLEADIQKGLEKGVVHYQGTAEPGKVGNSFITGHSSNYWWAPGSYNYVFVVLDKMEIGDQAIIYHKGNKFVYTVTSKKVVSPDDVSVMTQTATPTMTLMTCTPPGTSLQRLIISLDRTDPVYHAPREVVREVEITTTQTEQSKPSFFSRIKSFFQPN